ncbi:MAG TPA: glycosyltransferase [Acidimicrobiales bacterium]|nr:glycosyltransferase [Acidimicrobiales bacterium]
MTRGGPAESAGTVVVDLQALQSPTSRTHGIGRYAARWAVALERLQPQLVGTYLLNPDLPPPGRIEELVSTGKIAYRGAADAVGPKARIFHALSPFDLAVETSAVWPGDLQERGLVFSATVYDLIPARDPASELVDLAERRRYRTRLELARAAAGLQVLSEAVGNELVARLGVGSERVAVVGAAPDDRFRPAGSHRAARSAAIASLGPRGLRGRYVLYPSGSHPRKNNERLVEAWARLAEARRGFQLVITGELPPLTAHHLRNLVKSPDSADPVVVPGYVADDTLVALYQGAELVCFPSLAEGFGLPVAEARACDTPVICSNRPPLDELVPPKDRFDPEDVDDIARALAEALRDPPRNSEPPGRRGAMASWPEVAARSAQAFEDLLASEAPRPAASVPYRSRPVPRLAIVTPLPPAPSGVATYSFRLIEEIISTGEVAIDAFVDGPTPTVEAPAGVATYAAPALPSVERLTGRYDRVIYTFGNSHHHLGALALIRKRSGVVVSHDVRLTNLYRHETGDPGFLPHGLAARIRSMYGDSLPTRLGEHNEVHADDLARYGLLMAREVIGLSEVFLVSSHAAAALARVDAGPDLSGRVDVLPFAIESPRNHSSAFAEDASAPRDCPGATKWWGRSPEARGDCAVIGHFGIVDPVKAPELLVDAFAALVGRSGPGGGVAAMLAFVGPISEVQARALAERASARGVGDRLALTGPLSPDAYRAWLAATTLAVQLRRVFNGEASAAVGECLASGVPTVATRLGWLQELPEATVELVPVTSSDEELATVLAGLLADPDRRARLGEAGRALAERHSFAATARALLEVVRAERLAAVAPRLAL